MQYLPKLHECPTLFFDTLSHFYLTEQYQQSDCYSSKATLLMLGRPEQWFPDTTSQHNNVGCLSSKLQLGVKETPAGYVFPCAYSHWLSTKTTMEDGK